MIDLDNLRTASLYINNQLLSRGLIQDGQTIRFDRPGDSDSQLADTMGRIMGVVNDLILRRDVSTYLANLVPLILGAILTIEPPARRRTSRIISNIDPFVTCRVAPANQRHYPPDPAQHRSISQGQHSRTGGCVAKSATQVSRVSNSQAQRRSSQDEDHGGANPLRMCERSTKTGPPD